MKNQDTKACSRCLSVHGVGFTCSAFHIIQEPIRALKYHRSLQHHSIEKSSVCDKDLFYTR